jgi:hypothetical protein
MMMGSVLGLLCFVPVADAGDRSWYLGLEGGIEFDGGGGSADNGWAGLATIGSGITSHISVEAEFGYRSTSLDFSFYAPDIFIDFDQLSLMFNALYEAPIGEDAVLAIGLGVGGESIEANSPSAGGMSIDEEAVELAGQLKLGVSIPVSESTEIVANYRYMTTFGDWEMTNSTLTLGVRFAL